MQKINIHIQVYLNKLTVADNKIASLNLDII